MLSIKVNAGIAMSALMILHAAPVGAAAFMTGTELLSFCKKETDPSRCTGYIEGVTDTYMRLMRLRGASDQKPCLPDEIGASELKGAVIQHLEKNPSEQLYEAGDAVLMTIFSNWPACKPGAQ
jgi:hypothetical protein